MSSISISLDLRSSFGTARDQGPRPTCLAFATSDTHAAIRGRWKPLSCEYAFYHAQRRAGRPPNTGALLSSMLEAIRHDGQPEEPGWPYLSTTPTNMASWMPPKEVGDLFGRNGTTSAHTTSQVIHELTLGRPVIILLMLSPSFFRPSNLGVIDPAPGEQPEPGQRHAVVAVGHGSVNGRIAILVRNSWGPMWGDAGYGWLTEQFFIPRIFAAATLLEETNVFANSNAA